MLSNADNSNNEQTEECKTASLFTQKLIMIQQIQAGLDKEKKTMTSASELALAFRMQQQLSTTWTLDTITTVLIWITTLRESKKTLEPHVAEEYRSILLRNPDVAAVQQVLNALKKAWDVKTTTQLSSESPTRLPLPRRLAIFSPANLLASPVVTSPLIPAASQTAAAPDTLAVPRTVSLVATPSALYSSARVKDKKSAEMLLRYQPLNMTQRK
jgi:hypothetical protein